MNHTRQSSYPHIYRPKWYLYFVNSSLFLLMTLFTAAYFTMAILPYMQLVQSTAGEDFMVRSASILLFPVILASLITYLVLAIMLIGGMFAVLEIAPDGLEYRSWPQWHIRCRWPDVYLISKHLRIVEGLQLKHFEKAGFSFSEWKAFKGLQMEHLFIPLSKFAGWNSGPLAEDIHQFAPQLFNEAYIIQTRKAKEELQTSNERFLSSICHASFYLGFMGILLPIILWFEQKGKSFYVRFQAMQAILWQIVVHVFMILFLVILTVGLSLVIILGTLYQQEVWMHTLTLIGMGVLSLMTLVFLVLLLVSLLYPTIAILQTAQGKSFQFAWVGKWAKRE